MKNIDKKTIVSSISFGKRTAEEESAELEQYFVETDEWRRTFSGDIDIIYGAKGSGKSALYALLMRRKDALLKRNIHVLPAENVTGTLVFQDIVATPPTAEDEMRKIWKLYFLSLVSNQIRSVCPETEKTVVFLDAVEQAGLLPVDWNLKKALRAARTYLSKLLRFESVESGAKLNPLSGIPEDLSFKVSFHEPSAEERKNGYVPIDELFELADSILAEAGVYFWVVLDRLDVAFASSADLEANALRALFRVYLDSLSLERISYKIFLRDDIWRRISATGFRESSHITRIITIRWNPTTLLNLIVRRLLQSAVLCNAYEVVPAYVLDNIEEQKAIFYRIFPAQIDSGPKSASTFDWILSRVTDGTRQNVPRELIHLLGEVRRIQLERLNTGYDEPEEELLFERATVREALPVVSKIRLENTLYAEYPDVQPWLEALEREKTEQFVSTLSDIWGTEIDETIARADRLVQIGFFERRGTKKDPSFWVPFVYRPALELSQGSATLYNKDGFTEEEY